MTTDETIAELRRGAQSIVEALLDPHARTDCDATFEEFMCLWDAVCAHRLTRFSTIDTACGTVRSALVAQLRHLLVQRFHDVVARPEPMTDDDVFEWLHGAMHAVDVLGQLAAAIEDVTVRSASRMIDRNFSFAGRTEFIPIVEILQLIGGASNRGQLIIEAGTFRLDLYFDEGAIAYFDPFQCSRRLLPLTGYGDLREIPKPALARAERQKAADDTPLVKSFVEQGLIQPYEAREVSDFIGREALFELLSRGDPLTYRYRGLAELPDFAIEHDGLVDVTPVLLDLNDQVTQWRDIQRIFPDPDAPVNRYPDHVQAMADLTLTLGQIRMLAGMQDGQSLRQIADSVGLPLHEVHINMVILAQEGVVEPNCSIEVLTDLMLGGD
ncbi:MAG: DUF4388 domain-containing protein [Planctomycetes bacterium]|nr:DUF4388 domain-containing protein [Planctomycetota bacterium]